MTGRIADASVVTGRMNGSYVGSIRCQTLISDCARSTNHWCDPPIPCQTLTSGRTRSGFQTRNPPIH
jgi:hypothetical protein